MPTVPQKMSAVIAAAREPRSRCSMFEEKVIGCMGGIVSLVTVAVLVLWAGGGAGWW